MPTDSKRSRNYRKDDDGKAGSWKRRNDPIEFIRCPYCNNEQADMGRNVNCETCGEGPMPWHDDDGKVHL
jgi:hypothetical protein